MTDKSSSIRHAFTVDLEDWYQGIPLPSGRKTAAERRLDVGTNRLLDLLERRSVRATFFVLGQTAIEHQPLLRRIAGAGHDVGSHGMSHDFVYEMTPARFREETRSSMRAIEDCLGRAVRSYRAAYFSITRQSLWALEILAEEGIRYDSSIFPVRNWRYGIADYSRRPVLVETSSGRLIEFPISTRRIWGRNVATTGGAYFRIYPYALTRANMLAAEREGMPVVFYLHPWELDPGQPFTFFDPRAMVTHYWRLGSTAPNLARLLDQFRFGTLGDVLDDAFPELAA